MRVFFISAPLVVSIISAACGPIGETTAPPRSAAATVRDRPPSADVLPLVTLVCGAQISSDVRLNNDLVCAGNALLVGGDDITIDLNGHTLAGNGTGSGITVSPSHRVTIFGGSVRGFQSGIFVNGSTDVLIRDNDFTATNQAVLLQATTSSVIKHNTVTENLLRGFMIRPNLSGGLSTNNVVLGNLIIDTPTGIFLIRQPGNTIQNNTVIGATVAGIDLSEGTGEVSDNIVRANHFVGGDAGVRFTSGWIRNTFVGNRIEGYVCGFRGPMAGNTFNGNVLSGNTSDACP